MARCYPLTEICLISSRRTALLRWLGKSSFQRDLNQTTPKAYDRYIRLSWVSAHWLTLSLIRSSLGCHRWPKVRSYSERWFWINFLQILVLAAHSTDPPPISTTIRKCASEFKKVSRVVAYLFVFHNLTTYQTHQVNIPFCVPMYSTFWRRVLGHLAQRPAGIQRGATSVLVYHACWHFLLWVVHVPRPPGYLTLVHRCMMRLLWKNVFCTIKSYYT